MSHLINELFTRSEVSMNILQGYSPNTEPDPPDAKETLIIITRLEKVIADYLRPAKKMGLEVTSADIFTVINLALEEAMGKKIKLPWTDTASGFFLAGLYEELIQQPRSIFSQVRQADGSTAYLPLSKEIWKNLLLALRDHLKTNLAG